MSETAECSSLRDLLPAITVRSSVSPGECLHRLRSVALDRRDLEVSEVFTDGLGRHASKILELVPRGKSPHRNLKAQMISKHGDDEHVYIALQAMRWDPDPPTYEVYSDEARKILKPLLTAYNRRYGTRHRLAIQPKDLLEPTLPPTIEMAFHAFVTNANVTVLHEWDWRHFYQFVRACHYHGLPHVRFSLSRLLQKAGFPIDMVAKLTVAFEHCYEVLSAPVPLYTKSLFAYDLRRRRR